MEAGVRKPLNVSGPLRDHWVAAGLRRNWTLQVGFLGPRLVSKVYWATARIKRALCCHIWRHWGRKHPVTKLFDSFADSEFASR
jgi:hypothetical protein